MIEAEQTEEDGMGTFVSAYGTEFAPIPEERQSEFIERALTVMKTGGIFSRTSTLLCQKRIALLQEVQKKEVTGFWNDRKSYEWDGNYDYFSGSCWENIGIQQEKNSVSVYSGKVPYAGSFSDVVRALYCLMNVYTTEPVTAFSTGYPVSNYGLNWWLISLFSEHPRLGGVDLWRIYQNYMLDEELTDDWNREATIRSFLQVAETNMESQIDDLIEITAVQNGLEEAGKLAEKYNARFLENYGKEPFTVFAELREIIRNLKKKHPDSLSAMMQELKFYAGSSFQESADHFVDLALQYQEHEKQARSGWELEKQMFQFSRSVFLKDIPVYGLAVLCDEFSLDFRTEYRNIWPEGRPDRTEKRSIHPDSALTFREMYGIDEERWLAYWDPETDGSFSEDMEGWLEQIRKRLAQLIHEKRKISLQQTADLLDGMQKEGIYTFASFLDRCLEDFQAPEIQAYWSLVSELWNESGTETQGETAYSAREQVKMLMSITHNPWLFARLYES